MRGFDLIKDWLEDEGYEFDYCDDNKHAHYACEWVRDVNIAQDNIGLLHFHPLLITFREVGFTLHFEKRSVWGQTLNDEPPFDFIWVNLGDVSDPEIFSIILKALESYGLGPINKVGAVGGEQDGQ